MRPIKVSCYNCNSDTYTDYDSENGFKLVKCDSCGLLYVNPRPADEDISKYKLNGVHEGEIEIATTGRYASRKVGRYLQILKDFFGDNDLNKKGIEWFDIGCGYGELIEALDKYTDGNIIVKGSELNEIKIKSAQNRGLDVDFYDIDEMNHRFDVVSLFNVWSHLPDPVSFIEGLKKLLKPGGELFLETGHTSHLEPKDQQIPYYLPDHLSFASQDIVENTLKKVGFEIIETNIYRSANFPKWYNFTEIAIEVVKIVLRKNGCIKNFYRKHPNRDMFVRARLK